MRLGAAIDVVCAQRAMAFNRSFVTWLIPLSVIACSDATPTAAGGGASTSGVIAGQAGASGAMSSPSGGAGASSGGGGPSSGGVSAAGQNAGAAAGGKSASGGAGGSAGSAGGGAAGTSGSGGTSDDGTGVQTSGIPVGWVPVDNIDATNVPGPNFETVVYMFNGASCSGSSCHFGGRNHLTVNKPIDDLYKYMINFKTLDCGKLIDTANPAESGLVKYLRGPCGPTGRMPLDKCVDGTEEWCVPEYYIKSIEDWIAAGAPR